MIMMCAAHEMGFAKQVADKVVFIEEEQIMEDYNCEEFFGSPCNEQVQHSYWKF